ncbi:MAG: hypothetical protein OXG92_01310 [Chloroflexi bacterium]|nr:hypothetical protein [Chloroflexota bacterium]MCY3581482.1 hypothetical protein [Chloroflexota bacterium]MCY3715092.1 hypothetical protein [Chloroflexota bacterium]MDE2651166.1 hypothetical protein [Chloroflexota bacterium]MXV93913.1 hypothetical protein [Chloroflexota bacterium]
MKLLQTLSFIALAVAIGAVVGLLTSDMRADSAAAGAVVGVIIGSWLLLRLRSHQAGISLAGIDPQAAAYQDDLQEKHYQTKRWVERDSVTSYKIEQMADRR